MHEHVEYFPYGEVWRDAAGDRDGVGVKGQRFLFTGKELDEETGLYYFGARYLDPGRARWISPDPLGLEIAAERPIGLSVYSYASWSPLGRTDPGGLEDRPAPATMGPASPNAIQLWQGYSKADWWMWASSVGTERWTREWAYANDGSVVAPTWGDRTPEFEGQRWTLGANRDLDKKFVESVLNKRTLDQTMGFVGGGSKVTAVTKAVNSNLPHAIERGVERGVFISRDAAGEALRGLSDWITRSGRFPEGTLADTARAGRFLVPVGEKGLAVYQLGKNGTAKLKTVLMER